MMVYLSFLEIWEEKMDQKGPIISKSSLDILKNFKIQTWSKRHHFECFWSCLQSGHFELFYNHFEIHSVW
jgi:hypothetical protein